MNSNSKKQPLPRTSQTLGVFGVILSFLMPAAGIILGIFGLKSYKKVSERAPKSWRIWNIAAVIIGCIMCIVFAVIIRRMAVLM